MKKADERIGCKMLEELEEQEEKSKSPRDQELLRVPVQSPLTHVIATALATAIETHPPLLIRSSGVNPIDAAETNIKAVRAYSHCQKWKNDFFLY